MTAPTADELTADDPTSDRTSAADVRQRFAVAAVVIASAIGVALADSAPTGNDTIDLIERTLAAAAVTLAGAGSRRLYVIAFATVPTMFASPPWLFVGIAAILIVVAELALRRGPEPIVGAVSAGLAAQVAFRLGNVGITGLTALVGIGTGLLVVVSAINQRTQRVRRITWAGVALGAVVGLVITGFTLVGAAQALSLIHI